jgi:hypothetical protein
MHVRTSARLGGPSIWGARWGGGSIGMTFILAPERDSDPAEAFRRYREYLKQEEARFPPGAFALATSDWYFGTDDHRAPHDAWLLGAFFEEAGHGERRESRSLSLRLCLLGAYHDLELELVYPKVFAYRLSGASVARGHGDWRYDEFRVSKDGHLVHEIQWWGSDERATWAIESDDVVFTWRRTG